MGIKEYGESIEDASQTQHTRRQQAARSYSSRIKKSEDIMKKSEILYVRLDAKLHKEITECAKKEGNRSTASIARQAIVEFLERKKSKK